MGAPLVGAIASGQRANVLPDRQGRELQPLESALGTQVTGLSSDRTNPLTQRRNRMGL